MQIVTVETEIAAPPERCFLLSLNIDVHMASTAQTRERAVDGVTHGTIGLGETVTWRGRHFGFMLTHKTLISKYEMPRYFQDIMLEGMFRSFVHDHWFESKGNGTLMHDELQFEAPLGPLGLIAEKLVLGSYLKRFLVERNVEIKRIAEAGPEVWESFVTR